LLELSHQNDKSQVLKKREVNVTYFDFIEVFPSNGMQEKPLPQVFEEQREYPRSSSVKKKHTMVF
jgi:hypothetical protein